MARLREKGSDRRVWLPSRALIGRARGCDLELSLRSISGQHAALQWSGEFWEIVDLGSRNGTAVDGRRLAAGERAALVVGAELRFGREAPPWVLEEDGPPVLMARELAGGACVIGESGFLLLPDPQRAEIGVFQDDEGLWRAESQGEAKAVEDLAVLTSSDGAAWRLHLPTRGEGTLKESLGLLMVAALRLRFAVSRDEEHVELSARASGRSYDLKARAHHYPMLVLARQRLHDRQKGVAAAEEGWIRQEELTRMLRLDDNHLNISIHRARQQLAQLGVVDAAALVERRSGTRQVRLGVASLEVVTLGDEAPAQGAP